MWVRFPPGTIYVESVSAEADEIARLESLKQEQIAKLDVLVDRFVGEAAPAAKQAAEAIVRNAIQSNAYLVEQLANKLQEVKREVKEAITRLPTACREAVGEKGKW